MKKIRLKEKFLRIFRDIKILPYPPFLYYQPGDYYRASGADTRRAIDLVRPGDLLCRGYDSYLDGYFIPGKFTHTGVYTGNGKITHAIAEGVSEIDIIDFLRCDRFILIRPKKGQKQALERIAAWIGKPYDFDFTSGNDAIYCHELAAEAYKELQIQKIIPYMGFIRFHKLRPTYLAESFITNPNFKVIFIAGNQKPNHKEQNP